MVIFLKILKMNKQMSDIYGPMHLLRLFGNIIFLHEKFSRIILNFDIFQKL
jgi:hypothetical protein